MSDEELFYRTSLILTGFETLPEQVARAYWHRLNDAQGYQDFLPELIRQSAIRIGDPEAVLDLMRSVMATSTYSNLITGIIYLWYTAELIPWDQLEIDYGKQHQRTISNPTEYYSGLLWRAIQAHPPGLSGGYYGYWKYEPEN